MGRHPRTAGRPTGFFFPASMPGVAQLSDYEFELVAAAVMRPVADMRLEFRGALNSTLIVYVNARLAAKSLPSGREVALELKDIAKCAERASNTIGAAAEMVMGPRPPLHIGGVSDARSEAYRLISGTLVRENK